MKSKQLLNKIAHSELPSRLLIFIYLPILWLIISSISTRAELLSTPPALDSDPSNPEKLH